MFTELMPLLKQRVLVLTISRGDDQLICVSVIPKNREGATDENAALTIPPALTGKPAELDRDLSAQLLGFADSVINTGSNLEQLKAEHAAAVKAVDVENRKRLDEKRKINSKTVPPAEKPATAPEFKDGKPVFGTRPSPEADKHQDSSMRSRRPRLPQRRSHRRSDLDWTKRGPRRDSTSVHASSVRPADPLGIEPGHLRAKVTTT